MHFRIPASNVIRETTGTIRMGALISLPLLVAALLSISCQRAPLPAVPLPTLIPTAAPVAPTPAPESTAQPAPAASPSPPPSVVPSVPTVAAPVTYPSIEPANATSVQEAARATSGGGLRLEWTIPGDSLAVVTQFGISLFDSSSLAPIRAVTPPPPAKILDISPDGHTMATAKSQTQVDLIDVTTGELLRVLLPGTQFAEAVFSPDGRTLALASSSEIAVTLWDTSTGQQIKKLTGFQTAAPVYGVTFGPDGSTLIWRARGTVQLMNIATGRLGPVFSHQDFVSAVALAPGNQILATVAPGTAGNQLVGLITLWDATSGKEMATLTQANGVGRSICFSPDRRLLAAGAGSTIELWDLTRRQEIATLLGHTGPVNVVAFSPDGTALASTSDDGTARLWRVATPR
jgi:WD40 repeat protein